MANVSSPFRSERFSSARKLRERDATAEKMIDRATETASDLYEQVSDWVSDNRQAVMIGGSILAVGIVGFIAARIFMNRSESQREY